MSTISRQNGRVADTDADDAATEFGRGIVDGSTHERGGPQIHAVVAALDALAPEAVLVHGSCPDVARDLDVLVRPDASVVLAAELARAGFEPHGDDWILFGGGRVASVSLTPAISWGLTPAALDDLFESATAIAGTRRLVRPAPHHDLLILSRRLAGHPGDIDQRHRARADDAVHRDPDAWSRAAASAAAWESARALDVLRTAMAEARPIRRRDALGVRVEASRRDGSSRAAAFFGAVLSLRPRPIARARARRCRGGVVALSGIDGSGKSTQSRMVAEGLWSLGYDTVIEWSRITFESSLRRIGRPVKALLGLFERRSPDPDPPGAIAPDPIAPDPDAPDPDAPLGVEPTNRARALRERSRVIGGLWAAVVATVNASTLRRNTRRHLRAGRIVIRDRYVLDSVVQLEWAYANGRDLRWQARIIRLLVPRPLATFFLDVGPESAHGRKPEEFDVDELRSHRETYLRHTESIGAKVLDGSRNQVEVFEDIMRETIDRLRERDPR